MPPPIILIHRGDSPYLAHAIAQARSSNPESRVILLGDRSNAFYRGVEHRRYGDYFGDAAAFAGLYTADHFPNYQYPWILFCHQKYFALRDFCRTEGVGKFLLIDSDVMVYDRIDEYFAFYKDHAMTLSSASPLPSAQAAFSMVNDAAVIGDLCGIYEELFRRRPEDLEAEFGTRFFTEMLGLWVLAAREPGRIRNTYGDGDGFVIHHSLLEDARFEKDGELSRIHWDGDVPHFRSLATGRLLKSPAIHFHGHAKKLMGRNVRLRGRRFRMEHRWNRALSALAKYPMRWTNKILRRPVFPGL